MTHSGKASAEATAAFAQRFSDSAAGYFRHAQGLTVSSVGIGTYLGEPTPEYDDGYRRAICVAVEAGCNVIDSAINYRFQRSERSVGAALSDLLAKGSRREELVLCTKGGFLSFDGGYPTNPRKWVEETFVRPGIASWEEIVEGSHCMTPAYLRHQLTRSLENMNLDCVDVYYVHNPESQLGSLSEDEFYLRLGKAFEALEGEADDGRIQFYGTATWNGYRMAPESGEYLALERVAAAARKAGGEKHRLRFIQLPFNLAMPEAFGVPNQMIDDKAFNVLDCAAALGITVIASGSILQGRLAGNVGSLPDVLTRAGSGAAPAIQFARSAPGITTALIGMSKPEHAVANLKLRQIAPIEPKEFGKLFDREDN